MLGNEISLYLCNFPQKNPAILDKIGSSKGFILVSQGYKGNLNPFILSLMTELKLFKLWVLKSKNKGTFPKRQILFVDMTSVNDPCDVCLEAFSYVSVIFGYF